MGIVYLRGKKVEYEEIDLGYKTACWIVTNYKSDRNGYICLNFWDKKLKKQKIYKAHRLMYCQIHNIDIEDLEDCICHSCDICNCIEPKHLWNGTRADNNRDRDLKGRHGILKGIPHITKGELNGNSKLIKRKVLSIRAKKGIVLQKDLAKQYNVSQQTIGKIQNNKLWNHI